MSNVIIDTYGALNSTANKISVSNIKKIRLITSALLDGMCEVEKLNDETIIKTHATVYVCDTRHLIDMHHSDKVPFSTICRIKNFLRNNINVRYVCTDDMATYHYMMYEFSKRHKKLIRLIN